MQQYKILNNYVFFFLLLCTSSCTVQNKEIKSNPLPMGELVSELEARTWSVYQDQKGNYWFGSNGNGVFHYSEKKLIKYTTKDGLIENTIRGIQGDHLGNVFIETPKGVSKYDGKTFTTLPLVTSASNEWKLEPNDLWFNCNGNPNDIYRYDGKNLLELKLPRKDLAKAFGGEVVGLGFQGMNSSPYSVFGIDKDRQGNLWIGTIVAGVFRYDGKSFLWIPEKELSTLDDGRVPGVRAMLEDKDGFFWLSNFISKYKITEKDSTAEYEQLKGIAASTDFFEDQIAYFNSGLSDKEGNLWMTTYGGGVWKYDGTQLFNFPVKDGEEEALLVSIFQDKEGVLWLGTDNLGVFKSNGNTFEKFEP